MVTETVQSRRSVGPIVLGLIANTNIMRKSVSGWCLAENGCGRFDGGKRRALLGRIVEMGEGRGFGIWRSGEMGRCETRVCRGLGSMLR